MEHLLLDPAHVSPPAVWFFANLLWMSASLAGAKAGADSAGAEGACAGCKSANKALAQPGN
jgi:hypothetical protein